MKIHLFQLGMYFCENLLSEILNLSVTFFNFLFQILFQMEFKSYLDAELNTDYHKEGLQVCAWLFVVMLSFSNADILDFGHGNLAKSSRNVVSSSLST